MLVQEALDLIAVRPLNIMALVDEESKFPKVKYFFVKPESISILLQESSSVVEDNSSKMV